MRINKEGHAELLQRFQVVAAEDRAQVIRLCLAMSLSIDRYSDSWREFEF
jgi:hypothetical protein